MRLATFLPASLAPAGSSAAWRVGLVAAGGRVVIDAARALSWWRPTSGLEPPSNPLAWYDTAAPWFTALLRLHEVLDVDERLLVYLREAGFVTDLHACALGSPVPRPGKIIAVGLNYRDHAAEARMEVPESPIIFAKFPTAVIGSGGVIVLPPGASRVDYEAELAVVIGRRARGVAAAAALDVVLGYMNANDVSERDFQKRDGQWVRAKSCDTFAPLGPWIVTADEVADPNDLAIQLRRNGEVLQSSRTSHFVFTVQQLIEFLTATMTLEPGDVVLTGTPPGVGFARRPPVFLQPGDRLEVEIQGLGTLVNEVAADHVIP
jgi:acylpyruvate hydrolase